MLHCLSLAPLSAKPLAHFQSFLPTLLALVPEASGYENYLPPEDAKAEEVVARVLAGEVSVDKAVARMKAWWLAESAGKRMAVAAVVVRVLEEWKLLDGFTKRQVERLARVLGMVVKEGIVAGTGVRIVMEVVLEGLKRDDRRFEF